MRKESPGRLKVQEEREGGYRETNTHTHCTQTGGTHTHTPSQRHTLFPRLLPPPNRKAPNRKAPNSCAPCPNTHALLFTCLLSLHTCPPPPPPPEHAHAPTHPPSHTPCSSSLL